MTHEGWVIVLTYGEYSDRVEVPLWYVATEYEAHAIVSQASAWDRAFWDANPEWDDDGRDARWLDGLRAIGPHSETTIYSSDTIRFYPCKVAILEARP